MFKRSIKYLVYAVIVYLAVKATITGGILYQKLSKFPSMQDKPAIKEIDSGDRTVLFAIGDLGDGKNKQIEVAKAMEERCKLSDPDALLLLGDIVYPDGLAGIDDDRWQSHVFNMYGGTCLGKLPIFPVLGNHDYRGNPASWLEISNLNPRWWFPYRHYQVRFKDTVTIYAIDSNNALSIHDAIPGAKSQSITPWTIAIGHHPIISESTLGGRHKGGGLGAWLTKRAFCDHTDTYLSGHSHYMEHIMIDDCPMDQFVAGAGGYHLYRIKPDAKHSFGMSKHGFLEIEATDKQLAYRFYTTRLELVYEHQKRLDRRKNSEPEM